MVKEFKEFAVKGNAVDLAVGVIIGAAFGKIVTSIVDDLVMPLIGWLIGNIDFSSLYYAFGNPKVTDGMTLAEAKALGPVLAYGNFITIGINFLIVAFAIFLVIKAMNKVLRKEEKKKEEPAPAGPTDNDLLVEIRDLLKKKA